MISLGVSQYLLYAAPMDMRKGINSLSVVVRSELGRSPQTGEAFIFVGKRQDRLKVLIWKPGGFWLCQCRLERGRFRIPTVRHSDGRVSAIQLSELEWRCLLEGVVIERSKRLPRYGDLPAD